MKKFALILCGVLLCLTSCATTSKKKAAPSWVYAPYEYYSQDKYFAAVGNDQNRNIAELKAVDQLCVVFGIDLNTTNSSDTYMKHTESEVLSETMRTSELNQQILVEIDQKDLIGIEIAKTYYDSVRDEWYAIAILDKQKVSDLYASLVKSNNDAIKEYLSYANTLPDSIIKLAYLYKAYKLAKVSESFFIRFFIINPQKCTDLKSVSYVSSELWLQLEKLAVKIPVSVNINDDYSSLVKAACGDMLESFGMITTDNASNYQLNVKINQNFRTVENPTLYYCEFQVSAELKDKNGLILSSWDLSNRAGAKTKDLAEQKAYQLINQKIKEDFREDLEAYLYGEIK